MSTSAPPPSPPRSMSTSAPPPSPSPQPSDLVLIDAPRPPRPPRQIVRRILDIPMSRTIGEGNRQFQEYGTACWASEGDESAPSPGRGRGWDSPVESDLDEGHNQPVAFHDDEVDLDDGAEASLGLYDGDDEEDDPYNPANFLTHPPFEQSPLYQPAWATLSSLVTAVTTFAHQNGFDVRRESIRAENNLETTGTAYIKCTCSGVFRSNSRHPANVTSTQKTDCAWRIYASRPKLARYGHPLPPPLPLWTIKTPSSSLSHNHLPMSAIANRGLRAISFAKHAAYIEERLNLNDTPGQIRDALALRDDQCLVRATDISHFAFRLRQRARLGHSAAEDAVREIIKEGDLHRTFLNNTRELLGLFYSTHTARTLFARYPSVVFIDATYKTNRYGLRMLHFAGFTATNRTYTIATMFMLREDESWYKVALETFSAIMGPSKIDVVICDRDTGLMNALAVLWPSVRRLTCFWHLKENVKKNCKGGFEELDGLDGRGWMEAWDVFIRLWETTVVRAKSKEDFDAGMAQLRMTYHEVPHQQAIEYLEKIALFSADWADHHLNSVRHFNQRTNSRLEGLHKNLKKDIAGHNQDLLTVTNRLRMYFHSQFERVTGEFLIERSRARTDIPRHLESLRLRVSRFALKAIADQMRLAKNDLRAMRDGAPERPCTKVFRTTMGLPCAHELYTLINHDRKLTMESIDRHWWLPTQQGLATFAATSQAYPVELTRPIVLPDEFAAFDDLDNAILNPIVRNYSGAPKRIATQTERAVGSKRAQKKRLERERKAREREEKKAEREAAAAEKAAEKEKKKAEMAKKKADKGKKRARPSPNDRENDSQASPPPSQPFTQLPPPSTYGSTAFSFLQPHFSQPGPSRHPNALNLTYEQSQAETWYRPSPSPFQPPVPSHINPFYAPSHLQNAHYRPIQHLSQSQASHLSSYGGGGGGYGGGGENESESPNESLTQEVSGFGGFGLDSRGPGDPVRGEIRSWRPETYSLREEPVQPKP